MTYILLNDTNQTIAKMPLLCSLLASPLKPFSSVGNLCSRLKEYLKVSSCK